MVSRPSPIHQQIGCDELFDRNEEIEIFKTLDKNDFGVHFLASVPNGRIEEWSEYYDVCPSPVH